MPAAAKVWQQSLFFAVPTLSLLIALILEQAVRLPTSLGLLAPPWLWLTTYYWLGHRPQALSAPILLLLGLLHDTLRSWPILGITALILLLMMKLLQPLDHWLRTQSFRWVWALAVLLALAGEFLTQFILMIFLQRGLQPLLWVWTVCSAAGLYPLLGWLLAYVQRGTSFRLGGNA